jgi:hypothetical protein
MITGAGAETRGGLVTGWKRWKRVETPAWAMGLMMPDNKMARPTPKAHVCSMINPRM